jgi:hypothetical protein
MSQDKQPEGNLREEFRNLGQNIKNVLNGVWESQERRKLQKDVQDGLNELGKAVNELIDDIQSSEAGKKVVKGVDEFGEKLRSGEVEEKAREGILSTLHKINVELEKAISKFTSNEE